MKINQSESFGKLSFLSFSLTVVILLIARSKVSFPIILADRFLPGLGYLEIVALGLWAGFLTRRMAIPKEASIWRHRLWVLFTVVFFSQLVIGLSGLETFLMTGKLHLPVPALIVAGPIYRGSGLFMPILFLVTIILVGPAWCSYLCYIGAWDDIASRHKKKPVRIKAPRQMIRIIILIMTILAALLFRRLGLSSSAATAIAAAFGLFGVGIMVFWSARTGVMTHCTSYCPMGVVATWLGKISPFRIKINEYCTDCGACGKVCRYDALRDEDIRQRKPDISCTLCGDCLKACKEKAIQYRFLKSNPDSARKAFIVLATTLHAVFLGVARI